MRRYRRNADDRFRRIERAWKSGDPSAFAPYVHALRARGVTNWVHAAGVVRAAMIASGEWHPWPTFNDRIGSFEQASEENESNLWLASELGEPIAAPMLGVERENEDGDIETDWFEDGPYVVKIDPHDPEYTNRQLGFGEYPPGERAFIPLWRVSEVFPPPFGIPQRGYDTLKAGYGHDFQGTIDVEEGPVVHVDGVTIGESQDRIWRPENHEYLCTTLGMRMAGLGLVGSARGLV